MSNLDRSWKVAIENEGAVQIKDGNHGNASGSPYPVM